MQESLPDVKVRGRWWIPGGLVLGLSLALGACGDSLDLDLDPDGGEPTNEVDLAALVVSDGDLEPEFRELITAYTVEVDAPTDSILVTATTEASRATLEIDGEAAVSGRPFGPIALAPGTNVITVTIRGFDGITVQDYTLTVERVVLAATWGWNVLPPAALVVLPVL